MSKVSSGGATTDHEAKYDEFVVLKASMREYMNTVMPPPAIAALSRRRNTPGALHLALHVTLVGALAAIVHGCWQAASAGAAAMPQGVVLSVAAMTALVLQAFVMSFWFMPFHELSHSTVFTRRAANRAVGAVIGFLIFRPYRHYRAYHYNHHKYVGHDDRDPELHDSLIDIKLDNIVAYGLYLSGIPFWVDRLTTIARHGLLRWYVPREVLDLSQDFKSAICNEAAVHCVLYACAGACVWRYMFSGAGGASGGAAAVGRCLLWHWLLPTLLAQPFLRFYLVAEHTGCERNVVNVLLTTRTTETYWWYRWLAWNMPYHAEHHSYPSVPFHQLPSLHRRIREALVVGNSPSSARLPWALREDLRSGAGCVPSGAGGYLAIHRDLIRSFFATSPNTTHTR